MEKRMGAWKSPKEALKELVDNKTKFCISWYVNRWHDRSSWCLWIYANFCTYWYTCGLATQTPPLRIIKEKVLHIKKGLDKIWLSGGGRRGVH